MDITSIAQLAAALGITEEEAVALQTEGLAFIEATGGAR